MKKILIILFSLLSPVLLFSQNICSCYIPIDSSFQVVPFTQGPDSFDFGVPPYYTNNDASTSPLKLPFSFCFYGQSFDTVFINNNGNISFGKPIFVFSTDSFPLGTDTMMIAPFYSDVDTRDPMAGEVYYKMTPAYMVVQWVRVGYFSTDDDLFNTFQLIITNGTDPILPSGNNVSFCYYDMGWASAEASGGFGGYGGTQATAAINKGDGIDLAQVGTFNVPGSTYNGPFEAYNGLQWLNHKSFTFNTCVTGKIPPAIVEPDDGYNVISDANCGPLSVCGGSVLNITAVFVCTEPGQTCTLSASCPGIANFSIVDTSTVNVLDSVTVQLIPLNTEAGVHVLTVTATDNGGQVTSLPIEVDVNVCSGIKELNFSSDFSVYPNPGTGDFTLNISDQQSFLNSDVKIYDMVGTNIYSAKLSALKKQIDLSAQPKGIYFLKLFNENSPVGVKKIVIQ